jgi:magnesium transporter
VLALLALFWILTAAVIQGFEEDLKAGPVLLLAMLPMVMATGGMVGTQASALVIRALTIGDLGKLTMRRVVWKELRVAGLMALLLAGIAFADSILVSRTENEPDPFGVVLWSSGVIGLALLAHVLSAGLLGAVTPLVVKTVRGDPAMISTPAVTAIADLTGATIYLVAVTLLL